MQKFTVFSILFSVSVTLVIVDLVVHDYLSEEPGGNMEELEMIVEEVSMDLPETIEVVEPVESINDSEIETEEAIESTPTEEIEAEEGPNLDSSDEVELSEIVILNPNFSEGDLLSAGFGLPTLKDTIFSGLVFQIIPFSDQVDPFIYQWNFFDGEEFIGSIYELRYETETGSFQGYLNLRDRASGLPHLGEMNEVNNYGDASFYFNHVTKTKTVHMLMRVGSQIYAFEYAYKHHDKMKALFEELQ